MDDVGTPVSTSSGIDATLASALRPSDQPDARQLPWQSGSAAAAAFGSGDASASEGHKKKRARVLVPSSSLDLEQYIANYKDRMAKIERLLFIADRCPQLQIEAYTAAIKELAQTANVEKYQSTVQRLNDVLSAQGRPAFVPNIMWVNATLKESFAKTERLENELKMYTASLIKESTRMGYIDLGDHFMQIGDVVKASKNYTRAKDFCTTRKHIIDMCFKVIQTSISMGQYPQAQMFVLKAESIEDLPEKDKVHAKLQSVQGMIYLEQGAYRKACKSFLDVRFQHADALYETISPNDIAIYGALLALATYDRAELKSKIMENSNFKMFLELEPQIREALYAFNRLQFQTSLEILGRIKSELLLDMYMHEHVETLYEQIRKKAIIQFFYPYQSVRLEKMAASFGVSVPDLEREVAVLIGDGQMQARIDSHNKVLCATNTDERSRLYAKIQSLSEEYASAARNAILRAQLIERGVVVGASASSASRSKAD